MKDQIFIVKNPSTNYIKQVAVKVGKYKAYKEISEANFIKHTIRRILSGNALFIMSFADEDKKVVTGFVALSEVDTYDGKALIIENAWGEKTNRNGKKIWEAIKDIAKTLNYKKIIAETQRSTKAIAKKYGFEERSRIIEYKIEENSNG